MGEVHTCQPPVRSGGHPHGNRAVQLPDLTLELHEFECTTPESGDGEEDVLGPCQGVASVDR